MGVLAHLVPGMENGPLGNFPTKRIEGTSWRWDSNELPDANGDPMPLADLSTLTANCRVLDSTGTTIASPVFTAVADGLFSLSVDESLTLGLATGGGQFGRICTWALSLSDGEDVVQIWGPLASPFLILRNNL